jgi:hypothetical protein
MTIIYQSAIEKLSVRSFSNPDNNLNSKVERGNKHFDEKQPGLLREIRSSLMATCQS